MTEEGQVFNTKRIWSPRTWDNGNFMFTLALFFTLSVFRDNMDLDPSHCCTLGVFLSRLKYVEFCEASVLQGNVGRSLQTFLWMGPLFVLSSEDLLSIPEDVIFVFIYIFWSTQSIKAERQRYWGSAWRQEKQSSQPLSHTSTSVRTWWFCLQEFQNETEPKSCLIPLYNLSSTAVKDMHHYHLISMAN